MSDLIGDGFLWSTQADFSFLRYPPLDLTIGFGDASLDANDASRRTDLSGLFFADSLQLVEQVHGAQVVVCDPRTAPITACGDALIVPTVFNSRESRLYGIRTADCVPIVLVGEGGVALIHAGWRGLALRIIAEAHAALVGLRLGPVKVALIGPCARKGYRVGPEVFGALGACVQAVPDLSGGYFLDTGATAREQIRELGIKEIVDTRECTLTNPRYFSFRRLGSKQRNLCFLVI